MATFKNNICFYYNGKIYNQENDPLLKNIKVSTIISTILESGDHYIGFQSDNELHIIGPDTVTKVSRNQLEGNRFFIRPSPLGKGFQINYADSCFIVSQYSMTHVPCSTVGDNPLRMPDLHNIRSKLKITAEEYTPGIDNVLFSNTWDGSWMVDTTTFKRYEDLFLKVKKISLALVDKEKNIWIATIGEGVYKLATREFKTYNFALKITTEIFSL